MTDTGEVKGSLQRPTVSGAVGSGSSAEKQQVSGTDVGNSNLTKRTSGSGASFLYSFAADTDALSCDPKIIAGHYQFPIDYNFWKEDIKKRARHQHPQDKLIVSQAFMMKVASRNNTVREGLALFHQYRGINYPGNSQQEITRISLCEGRFPVSLEQLPREEWKELKNMKVLGTTLLKAKKTMTIF